VTCATARAGEPGAAAPAPGREPGPELDSEPPRELTPQETFGEATRLYREAAAAEGERKKELYREAATLYAELAGRTPNGRVLYDLGNARFRAGELGRAIAAYRRAERLLPRHRPTRANLAYARDLAPGGGPGREPHPAAAAFFFWHYAMSLAETEAVAVLVFLALLGLLAARSFAAEERLRRRLATPAVAAGVLFAIFALSSLAKLADSAGGEGVIVAAEARVRSEPSGRAVDLFTLREGAEVRVATRSGGWTRVTAGADRRGWVESRAVEVLSDPPYTGP
jgi:hypothetical protein